jgi:hypothetical protein
VPNAVAAASLALVNLALILRQRVKTDQPEVVNIFIGVSMLVCALI